MDVTASKNLTFNEANARLTELLCGRTVDCVMRKGKELIIVLTNGCQITMQADVNGDIHYKGHETKIYLSGIDMGSDQGAVR